MSGDRLAGKGVSQHSSSMTGLKVYDLLLGDPRVQKLLRRLSNFNRSMGSWLGPARDFQTRNEQEWRLAASVVQILLAVVAAYHHWQRPQSLLASADFCNGPQTHDKDAQRRSDRSDSDWQRNHPQVRPSPVEIRARPL